MPTKQEFQAMAVELFEEFKDFIKPIEFETSQDYDPLKANNSRSVDLWSGIPGAIKVEDRGENYAVGDVTFKMLANGIPVKPSISMTKATIEGKKVIIKGYVLDPAGVIYTLDMRFV